MSRSGVTDVSHARDPEVAASGIAQWSVWPSARFLPSSMLVAGLLNGVIVAFPNKRD